MTSSELPSLAVIGGSGFYAFLDDVEHHEVDTPYGAPSAPVAVGSVGGRSVAFLPRHGPHHEFPPHAIKYRANIWALRSLGVRRILAPCAVGGLSVAVVPGDLVVPDQLVDRTASRTQTFYDSGAVHAPFADPYCPELREALLARELGLCYATLALVTDLDAGVDAGEAVRQGAVFATFAEHIDRMKQVLSGTIADLGEHAACSCADWLEDVALPFDLP